MGIIYFDNAASTIVREEAVAAMLRVLREDYGNPSSSHCMGRRASAKLSGSREIIASALHADPSELFFTSGGTESANWAILVAAEAFIRKGRHIVTSTIEHDAVLEPIKKLVEKGWEATYIEPDSSGSISVEAFASALRDDTALASVMLVNNETGVINPVDGFAAEIKKRKLSALLHTDAVQGFCKIPFFVKSLGADLLTISAHKIHGPTGTGALYIRSGVKLPPLIRGGGQENGARSGTEALPAIAGFSEAARLGSESLVQTSNSVRSIREYIIERVTMEISETVIISGDGSPFLLSLSLPGYKSEVLMSFLDNEGICVSKGSACKKGARSRVLEAMRLKNEVIDGALRLSFSGYNTMEEAAIFVDTLKRASQTLLHSR